MIATKIEPSNMKKIGEIPMISSFDIEQVSRTLRATLNIGSSGGFVTSFCEVWFQADEENKPILYKTAVVFIDKYELEKFKKMCDERKITYG